MCRCSTAPPVARARRARGADRPQRRRQVLAAEDPGRAGACPTTACCRCSRACAASTCRRSRQFARGTTVFDAVADGVAEARALRARYEAHADGEDLDALQTPHRGAGRLDLGAARGPSAAAPGLDADGRWMRCRAAAQARGAGAGAGGRARRAAARRADQPPRHRRHRVAAGPAGGLAGALVAGLARPRLHRRRGHAHRRAGPRPAAQLPGQFRAAFERRQGARARGRGAGRGARRQAAGAGGGLDPQGRGGAPHAQRRPCRAAAEAARAARARREQLGQVRLESTPGCRRARSSRNSTRCRCASASRC
jgi:hypothetical protein